MLGTGRWPPNSRDWPRAVSKGHAARYRSPGGRGAGLVWAWPRSTMMSTTRLLASASARALSMFRGRPPALEHEHDAESVVR